MYYFIEPIDIVGKKQKLEKEESQIKLDYDKLDDIITNWVSSIRKGNKESYEKIRNMPHIWRDMLLWPIRRMQYGIKAFHEIQEPDMDSRDAKCSMLLVFFVNAKFLFEVIKKHVKVMSLTDEDENLYETISLIRNYLAHADGKRFDGSDIIVQFDMNFKSSPLEILELYDLNTGMLIGNMYFSINKIYNDLVILIEKYLHKL